jgi:hypothetical protein
MSSMKSDITANASSGYESDRQCASVAASTMG